MTTRWTFTLDGVTISTDLDDPIQMTKPPSGLGNPAISTTDVSFPRQDGVEHFEDWYGPRIIGINDVIVRAGVPCGFDKAASLFENTQALQRAWGRRQEDVEAWVTINEQGPFAVVGRPRQCDIDWGPSRFGASLADLRFDARDHLLYLLDVDEDGNVIGDGWREQQIDLTTDDVGRTYDRVYPMAYGISGSPDLTFEVGGSAVLAPTIEFVGPLNAQISLENLTTGHRILYNDNVLGGASVVFDLQKREVTSGGASRYSLASGDLLSFRLVPGNNTLRLNAGLGSTGHALVRWRPALGT